ncbi:MAG: M23 family metallopeptidase [Alphaproteobacteria bacterium]|nr:M23 family metallopeptidase [Alphaproteobacteria bacterium]
MRMRIQSYVCALVCGICFAARASLLRPATFPKTVDDLSFVERLMLRQEGYEPFESVYDKDGNCISGCAYAAPRLEDELAAMARWNAIAKKDLVETHGYTQAQDETITPPATRDYNIPYGNPLRNMACITSPYTGSRTLADGTTSPHYAIDFRASTGTPVYAPANGTVLQIVNDNRCGNGIVLRHGGGYTTVYCHLSEVSVTKDQSVQFGVVIAKTGETGHADGPHLHYAVKLNGNPIDPQLVIEPGHKQCNEI